MSRPRPGTAAHRERITTPFGFATTAAEVAAGVDLTGLRAVVTGASAGIGVETARTLAGAGAEVVLAVRDPTAGARVATDISTSFANARVQVGRLDLADLESVTAFAAGWDGPLDLLVNNAGVLAPGERQLTTQGWELHFATNHLGHFALAVGLHDALAAAGSARIVSLSSVGHLRAPLPLDDLQFATEPYESGLAYGRSKTANVLFAVEATRRWAGDGITANAVHPGAISETMLTRDLDEQARADILASGLYTWKTIEQGAATSIFVATSPQLEGIGGRYFEDCAEAPVVETGPGRAGVAAHALDPLSAERLWTASEALLR
jgi:NAD(P)-dependent dehydrogenase (short-subunit alcohol dehydrogenase family)